MLTWIFPKEFEGDSIGEVLLGGVDNFFRDDVGETTEADIAVGKKSTGLDAGLVGVLEDICNKQEDL